MIKTCEKHGVTERYKNGKCKQCVKEYNHQYRIDNAEKIKQYAKEYFAEYYKTNSDKVKQRVHQWRKDNPERHNEWNREWLRKNPEKQREMATRWRKQNPEKEKASRIRRYYTNYEKYREQINAWKKRNLANGAKNERLRRARKAQVNIGSYNFEVICNYYGNVCLCCRKSDVKLTVDHIIPISMGGDDIIQNIQPLCGICNSRKNNRVVDYRPLPYPSEYVAGYREARKVMG